MYWTEQQQQIIIKKITNYLLENFQGFKVINWTIRDVIFSNDQKTAFFVKFDLENIKTKEIKKFEKFFLMKFKD